MKILLVEGPDNAGKTTLIKDILDISNKYELIEFPKRTKDGRFDIKSRNEIAIFETMLNYLDKDKVYILDRGYMSNIVYATLRAEHKEAKVYDKDLEQLCEKHDVFLVALTRNKIACDFEDDLISLSSEGFNKVIDLFEEQYEESDIDSVKILDHSENNNIVGIFADNHSKLISEIIKWAR